MKFKKKAVNRGDY